MTAKRRPIVRVLRGAAFAALGFVGVTVLCVLLMRWIDPVTTAFIARDRFIAWKNEDARYVYRRTWVDLDAIAKPMRLAVIASEDQKFATHFGFDLEQISDALDDRANRRRTRGASTITQQTAKNLFLWPNQSWIRKGVEAYFTVLIETLWPKRRILEVYLNVAEFGPGVYGVEAAARTYFRKPAARLTAHEAALLAAVLPSPKRLKANAPSRYVRSRQQWILEQMSDLGGAAHLERLN